MNENMERSAVDVISITGEVLSLLEVCGSACNLQAEKARHLKEKLESRDMVIAVIGQFKRGKSKLSNRILGDEVFPVGIVPITSAVTSAKYGERAAEIHFLNGEIRSVDFSKLEDYISEQKNGNNALNVREVRLRLESEFLKRGITYVDTPGVGSFHKNNTETAYEYMKESDGVIFLLSVDSPINQIEIDFLKRAEEYAGKFYFVVNKIDLLTESELGEYLIYCEKVLKELTGKEDIELHPVSAEDGRGVEELKAAIDKDLNGSLKDIMRESARKKLIDITGDALKQLGFYRRTLSLPCEDLDRKFSDIDEFLTEKHSEAEAEAAAFPYEFKLNNLRLSIGNRVSQVFEMDYILPVESREEFQLSMNQAEYLKEVTSLTEAVRESLSEVLLYREDNAFTVVRRMEDIYGVTRRLRSIKNRLERAEVVIG